jgi:hypothetical protein
MNANENKTAQPTPEQLLKMLDLQMQSMRSKRSDSSSRNTVRAVSILAVLMATAAALFYLMTVLDDARQEHGARSAKPPTNQQR